MSKHDDEIDEPLSAIGEEALKQGLVVEDTSPPLDPSTFDMDAFTLGVRPTRRTVKLYARSDLIGVLDAIVSQIDDTPEDEDVDHLVEQYNATRAAYVAACARWTVEKRSSEWVAKRWEDCAAAEKITLDADGNTTDLTDRLTLLIDQLAGQVVAITALDGREIGTSVTHDQLRAMFDQNEGEFNKLIFAMTDANSTMGSSAKVLTRDFSRRSSTARSGQAS